MLLEQFEQLKDTEKQEILDNINTRLELIAVNDFGQYMTTKHCDNRFYVEISKLRALSINESMGTKLPENTPLFDVADSVTKESWVTLIKQHAIEQPFLEKKAIHYLMGLREAYV